MAGSGCDLCDLSELHALILEHLLAARVPQEALATVQRALEVNGQPSRLLQRCNDPKIPKEAAKKSVVNLEGLGKNDGKHEVNTVKTVETEGGKSENQGFTSQNGYNGWMLAALGVFLLSMVFAPCVTYSEWYIDELFAAVRNADARGETPLLDLLQHDFWGNSLANGWTHKSYRPLVVLSYAAQYWMNGWDFRPQPLRTLNVALHSTNALLLLFLMRQLRISKKFAFLAAGCFAVHPVHAENVIYLVGRADSMATCCWLLALLVWLSGKSRTFAARILRIGLVTVLALVAGFCKESGFCVLLQLAAIELMGRRPVKGSLPFLLIFALTFLGRSWITQGTSAGFSFVDTPVQYRSDPWLRLATYLYFHAKYAQLMVWPWTLSWDYSYNALPDLSSTWRDLRVLAILMTYLGLSALASWTISQRNRRVLIGLSNIIIPFVPASNLFFVVGVTVGERLLYPCNVGAALVLAAAGSFPKSSRSKGGFGVLAATLLVTFTWLGALRTYQWSSRELLFGADAKSYPQSTKNRHQFGTVLHKMERYSEALHHFEAAEAIFDGTGLTQYCIGQILLETGRAKEAEEKFAKILSGHALGFGSHNLWSLYIDYGFSLVMMKRFEDAIQPIKEGLRRNEDVPYGLNALGYAYIHLGMNEEARAAFQLAMKYDPENAYLENNLGIAKLLLGELNEGALHVAQAARMEPAVPAFAYNVNLLNEMAETQRWPQTNFALELYYNRGM